MRMYYGNDLPLGRSACRLFEDGVGHAQPEAGVPVHF